MFIYYQYPEYGLGDGLGAGCGVGVGVGDGEVGAGLVREWVQVLVLVHMNTKV